jgi:hypothetical protein
LEERNRRRDGKKRWKEGGMRRRAWKKVGRIGLKEAWEEQVRRRGGKNGLEGEGLEERVRRGRVGRTG